MIDWHRMWTPQWSAAEVVLRATIVYVFVQLLIRLLGRKELGRFMMYDIVLLFLVSVAARMSIVGNDTSITSAAVALATLFGLEWLMSFATARSARLADVLQGRVTPLVRDGVVDERALRRKRVSIAELQSQARLRGHASLADVRDAWLERSGEISLVFRERS